MLNSVIIFIFLLVGFYAHSKSKQRPTRIEFSDELIRGETVNPDLFYLLKRRQASFKKLIPLRDNFLPELKRTSDYLKSNRKNDLD